MSDDRVRPDGQLVQTGELLAAARSVDDVVAVLRRSARRMIGADGIAIVLRDDGCCHYVAEDANQPLWRGRRFPLGECVSGWAMLNDETVVIPDIGIDPRVPFAPYRDKAITSLVIVPVGSPEPVAALGAYWCAMVLPGTVGIARLKALARQAGAALARLQAGMGQPAIPACPSAC